MPRFKPIDTGLKLIPVCFESQIQPGSFEHAVCVLIDQELNLSDFMQRYKNEISGASAFHPSVLLKVILVAYSKGIISSRKIEACCRENVLFMALSGDNQPHFTTIADFIACMSEHIASLFAQVLLICDREKLIDRSMFAIDGIKLPSNAEKSKSGTRSEYMKQLSKIESKVKAIWNAINEKKSRVAPVKKCSFLGFTFPRNKLRWTTQAFEDFKYRIRKLTGRSWGVSMEYRFHKLAEYVRRWMGYFGISEYYRPIPELDEWLRRRVRMCYWKQWRRCRTKVTNLLRLGVYKRIAILAGISSKSYWRLSKSLATQAGMTNDWLKKQGLISIRDCWMKAHGYA